MSNMLRNMKRKLKPDRIRLAEEMQYNRVQLARNMVRDRCEKDAEFAKDVLKAVGKNLPKEIKEACEKTIASEGELKETNEKEISVEGQVEILKAAKEAVIPREVFQLKSDNVEA